MGSEAVRGSNGSRFTCFGVLVFYVPVNDDASYRLTDLVGPGLTRTPVCPARAFCFVARNLSIIDLDFVHDMVRVRQGKGSKDRLASISERTVAWPIPSTSGGSRFT